MNPIIAVWVSATEDERKEFLDSVADTNVGLISNAVWRHYRKRMEVGCGEKTEK